MRFAFALRIFSGKISLWFRNTGASADAPVFHFHGEVSWRKTASAAPASCGSGGAAESRLALSVTFGDSSPKGRAKSTAGNFIITPNTLVTSLRPWLPLRGKTSPAPGEDVAYGDKRGNLARERLRGFASGQVYFYNLWNLLKFFPSVD